MKEFNWKAELPYLPIPVIAAAFVLLKLDRYSAIVMLTYALLIGFGYVVAYIDWKTKTVPNMLILAMLAAWTLVSIPQIAADLQQGLAILQDALLGLAVGGGLFLLVYLISKKGLGGGDVKFMAVAGLYLGFGGVLPTMLLGSLLASVFGLVMIVAKRLKQSDTIPLTPFLYGGILIVLFLF